MEMKWINCKEELPPKEGSYLLYDSCGGCWISYDKHDAEWPWMVTGRDRGRDRGIVEYYRDSWLKNGDKYWLKGPSKNETGLSCCICNDPVGS